MLEATAARVAQTPGLDRAALALVQSRRVAVLGAGAIGGNTVLHAAQLGIPLRIVDCDRVAPENLGSSGFPARSVGEWKSLVRAQQALEIDPELSVEASCARIEDLGLAELSDCGLILGGLDGRAARARVSELSSALGIPWLDGSVSGDGHSLIGSVALYDAAGGSACYCCPHDAASLAALLAEERGPGCPSWRDPQRAVTPPTLQGSALPALVSALQVMTAVPVLLGRGAELVGGRVLLDCAAGLRVERIELAPNPRCLARHAPLGPLRSGPVTVVGLWRDARARLGGEPDALELHHRTIVSGLRCRRCHVTRPLVRLATRLTDEELRCDCGAPSDPAELIDAVGPDEVAVLGERSWHELGLPRHDVVTAVRGDRELHYRVCGNAKEGGA